ncbi:ribosomal protein S5 domain 2-type protein [Dipodascopsis uninucleata]
MPLSVSEEAYINASLSLRPPCRPDGRDPQQFRPIDAAVGLLPQTNGSTRIRLSDGGECIVGVKAEVVKDGKKGMPFEETALVSVDCDIMGVQTNSSLNILLRTTIESAIKETLPPGRLQISKRYRYKLYIDGVILDHTSHPLTLFSMATYLALLDTRLPRLANDISITDLDENATGIPQFSSDWADSYSLCDDGWRPPLVQLAILAGKNVFIDPTAEETSVSDGGIISIWHEERTIGLQTINTRDTSRQVFRPSLIEHAVNVLSSASMQITSALDGVI